MFTRRGVSHGRENGREDLKMAVSLGFGIFGERNNEVGTLGLAPRHRYPRAPPVLCRERDQACLLDPAPSPGGALKPGIGGFFQLLRRRTPEIR